MNVYLSRNAYDSPGFRDPMMYDTRLTAAGAAGARAAAKLCAGLQPRPQLLVVSPLTRALQTAEHAFGTDHGIPTLVEPLWREVRAPSPLFFLLFRALSLSLSLWQRRQQPPLPSPQPPLTPLHRC